MKTSQTISSIDLTFVADALLSLCEKTPGRPFYSEEGLQIKLKLADRRDPVYGHLACHQSDDPLLRRECLDVFSKANLTHCQRDVLFKRLEGWTFEEIGCSAKHSKQAARNIFAQSLKKIARAYRVYPYKGLSEVYHQETHRGLNRGGLNRGGLGTIPRSAH